MSGAERMQRTRERHRSNGSREYLLRIQGPDLEFVEASAAASGQTPTKFLGSLIKLALATGRVARKVGREMLDAGATDEEVDAFMRKLYGMDASPTRTP